MTMIAPQAREPVPMAKAAAVRPLTVELIAELHARKADIACIPTPLERLIAAAKWHIETNGEGSVGRDGRARVTIAAIISTHAVLDAIKFAEGDNGAPADDVLGRQDEAVEAAGAGRQSPSLPSRGRRRARAR